MPHTPYNIPISNEAAITARVNAVKAISEALKAYPDVRRDDLEKAIDFIYGSRK